jgi:hypothetical protein
MIGNCEWSGMNMSKFAKFRDVLNGFAGAGAAIADVTTLWEDVLKTKRWYDLSGNGVNHPNDFGHRLYAQVILGLLIEGYGKK